MGKFTIQHEIHCNEETFWKVFLDKDFNVSMYTKSLGFPSFEVVDQKETETQITRKVKATPKMDVPGPLQKLFGPNFGYIEEGSMDKATKVWKWKMQPNTMADKLFTSGVIRAEKIGDGSKVRRISEVTIEAKVFAVGGLIESTAEKQIRDGWEKSAHFMNKWIAEHK